MSPRCFATTCVLAVVIALPSLAPVFIGPTSAWGLVGVAEAAGGEPSKAQTAAAETWTPPRTPDGQPDLQGFWSNRITTPLERELTGKQTLTQKEAEEREDARYQAYDRPPREGDPGTYNSFWRDRGTVSTRTSLVVDPADGRIPPLTAEAQKKQAATVGYLREHPSDGPEDRDLWDRCITRGVPRLPGGYNNNFQILQTAGYVVVLQEMIHEARIIPLDGRPHVGPNLRQWNGDSRGHWEGNTLVVDTTNFSSKQDFRGLSQGTMHLVERFTRVDPTTINWEVTIDDPTTYTKTWTAAIPLTKTQDPPVPVRVSRRQLRHGWDPWWTPRPGEGRRSDEERIEVR